MNFLRKIEVEAYQSFLLKIIEIVCVNYTA